MIQLIKNNFKENLLLIIVAFAFLLFIFALGFFIESANNKGIEIINNPTFVGEVISKDVISNNNLWYFSVSTEPTYQMRIVGEYISDNNQLTCFNKVLYVDFELFNTYEVGDIISY